MLFQKKEWFVATATNKNVLLMTYDELISDAQLRGWPLAAQHVICADPIPRHLFKEIQLPTFFAAHAFFHHFFTAGTGELSNAFSQSPAYKYMTFWFDKHVDELAFSPSSSMCLLTINLGSAIRAVSLP